MDETEGFQPRAAGHGRRARQAALTPQTAEIDQDDPRTKGYNTFSRDKGSDAGEGDSNSPPPPPRRGGFESNGGGDSMQERMSPPPAAKTGAFGMDLPPSGPPRGTVPEGIVDGGGKFTGVSRRKQDQRKQEEEDKKKETSKYDDRAKDIEGILEIEEEGREDLTAVVAEAPKVRSNKVQDIAELEDDEMFRLPASEDRDIDLSLLTAILCSSEQVYEIDEVWDQDTLFTQVASELHLEMDRAEGASAEGKENEGGAIGQIGQ